MDHVVEVTRKAVRKTEDEEVVAEFDNPEEDVDVDVEIRIDVDVEVNGDSRRGSIILTSI